MDTIASWQPVPKHKLLSKTLLFAGAGIVTGIGVSLAGYAVLREPLRVYLDHLTVRVPNGSGHIPAQGLRILHLSDTHFRGQNWRERAKIESVQRACRNLEYDLLIHTGDFLHEDPGLENVLTLLDALPPPRLGSYAVFGNHDHMQYSHDKLFVRSWQKFREREELLSVHRGRKTSPAERIRQMLRFAYFMLNVPLDLKRTRSNDTLVLEDALASRNITLLHNRFVRLTCDDDHRGPIDLYIAGVEDYTEGVPDLLRALDTIPQDAPTLLLSHNPDILSLPGIENVNLVLSGHTHGGQIVLPLLGPAHTQSTYLERHEVAGYLRRGSTHVHITRGVGEGIPVRFRARPQITLITIEPESA